MKTRLDRRIAALGAVMAAVSCGGGSGKAPTNPLLDPSQARTPNTVIITSAGVNPQDAHLDAPVTVTFMNKDTVPHTPEAAPELGNGDCPEMAEVGTIAPEQSGKVTITKTEYICSYHDKAQPSNVKFKGVIVVH